MLIYFLVFVIFSVVLVTYSKLRSPTKRESYIDKKSVAAVIKDYPTVLDRLVRSYHQFESSDCSETVIPCKTDTECRQVCVKPSKCDEVFRVCKGLDDSEIVNSCGKYGVWKRVYDVEKKIYIYKCVCTSPHYTGDACTEASVYCDSVLNDVCICNEDKSLFSWLVDVNNNYKIDVCVPNVHYRLFASQDDFKPAEINYDWFNYGMKSK